MKICHIGPSQVSIPHDRGGALERRIAELGAAQARRGHDVTVFSRGATNVATMYNGINIEYRRLALRGVPRSYELLCHARRWSKSDRPDVIHFHGLPDGALAFATLDIPMVLTVDYYRFWLSSRPLVRSGMRWYLSRALQRFDNILPDSTISAELFERLWGAYSNIDILSEGVNTQQFRPDGAAAARARGTYDLEGPVVLYVGRLCEQKGTHLLLDAWEHSLARRGTLVLAGPIAFFGNTLKDRPLLQRIDDLNVRYLGAVLESELAALYNACDIFVMPTIRNELFGMAALEAQACGKPVVASRCGALPETVAAGAGIFFEPGDSSGLARAIASLLDDPGLRERLGRAGVQHASRFDWDVVAERLEAIYEKVLKRGFNISADI